MEWKESTVCPIILSWSVVMTHMSEKDAEYGTPCMFLKKKRDGIELKLFERNSYKTK